MLDGQAKYNYYFDGRNKFLTVKHLLVRLECIYYMCPMAKNDEPTPEMIRKVFAAMGKRGGPARAQALSAKRRKEIAKAAAAARWGKKPGK